MYDLFPDPFHAVRLQPDNGFFLGVDIVDAFDKMVVVDENEIDWKQTLKKWIASAKEDEKIFTEVHLSGWNEVGERKKEIKRN